MAYAVKIIWRNGAEAFVNMNPGGYIPARFSSRAKAQEMAESFQMGLDQDEVQSINVVEYPKKADW